MLDAGAEDPEHPAGKPAGPAVQRALQALADGCGAEGLRQHFWQAGAYVDAARLRDLCDPETDHAWIWDSGALGAGDTFDREEFVEAVRVRLGTGGPAEPTLCGHCGAAVLDSAGAHASTCCLGEATIGHNLVKETLHRYAIRGDPGTELEPVNLVRSRPLDRPADVLSAAPGRLSAIDVGVTRSAIAVAEGEDAAEAMWRRKMRERAAIREELEDGGVVYVPVVWTHLGRPHPQAVGVMRGIARAIARRSGCTAVAVERALRADVGAAIARRAARMSLAANRSRFADGGLGQEGATEGGPWRDLEEAGSPVPAELDRGGTGGGSRGGGAARTDDREGRRPGTGRVAATVAEPMPEPVPAT